LLQHEVGRLVCRSTAPGANRPGTHSHPGRVLLQYGVVTGSSVGAPPDRRTARCEPVRHTFAPEANATSTATPTAPSTPPNSNTPPPNSPPTNSTTPAWPTAYLPP